MCNYTVWNSIGFTPQKINMAPALERKHIFQTTNFQVPWFHVNFRGRSNTFTQTLGSLSLKTKFWKIMEDLTLVPGDSPITQGPSTLESSNRVKCKKIQSIMVLDAHVLCRLFSLKLIRIPFSLKSVSLLDSILSQANLNFCLAAISQSPSIPTETSDWLSFDSP